MRWDIFCKVIDNHGDMGVCWRLACDLAGRGDGVRLFADDLGPLAWMAPLGHAGVDAQPWERARDAQPGDVVIEAFGCDPEPAFVAAMAQRRQATGLQPGWINLEYLSAEPWVERCHGLPSPVQSGPGAGLAKRFFYPGFTGATGGLIREPDLFERQAAFDRAGWLRSQRIDWNGQRLLSLFCYEPPGLPALLSMLAQDRTPTMLLVTPGRAEAAVRHLLAQGFDPGALTLHFLPLLPQPGYDELLWACDLNFVRGEDSVVRALWAGKPLVWNPYPQDDGAHWPKLDAFLDRLAAPGSLRAFHRAWNGAGLPLPALDLEAWRPWAVAARDDLGALPDLVGQLKRFAGSL
jgi:uncharacterized repeat protein (TIGR03837 family)